VHLQCFRRGGSCSEWSVRKDGDKIGQTYIIVLLKKLMKIMKSQLGIALKA
jgi:hypothetical protein